MGGIVKALFGGGDAPDNSAQLDEMRRNNALQSEKLAAQQKSLDDKTRDEAAALAAARKARRGGGARALMDAQRLNPEAGLPGQDSATRSTLGPG